jgi:hypothetical protein
VGHKWRQTCGMEHSPFRWRAHLGVDLFDGICFLSPRQNQAAFTNFFCGILFSCLAVYHHLLHCRPENRQPAKSQLNAAVRNLERTVLRPVLCHGQCSSLALVEVCKHRIELRHGKNCFQLPRWLPNSSERACSLPNKVPGLSAMQSGRCKPCIQCRNGWTTALLLHECAPRVVA